jgi:CheY-like chemotaxis protein
LPFEVPIRIGQHRRIIRFEIHRLVDIFPGIEERYVSSRGCAGGGSEEALLGRNSCCRDPETAMTKSKQPALPETILIVDDDRNITLAMKEILRRGGYEHVLSAVTSTKGLRILSERGDEISVLVLDMRMPDIDGLAVVSHLLDVHTFPLAVIMSTAYGSKQKSAFLKFSSNTVFAAGYIEKPFDHDFFIDEVRKAIEKTHVLRARTDVA